MAVPTQSPTTKESGCESMCEGQVGRTGQTLNGLEMHCDNVGKKGETHKTNGWIVSLSGNAVKWG